MELKSKCAKAAWNIQPVRVGLPALAHAHCYVLTAHSLCVGELNYAVVEKNFELKFLEAPTSYFIQQSLKTKRLSRGLQFFVKKLPVRNGQGLFSVKTTIL